MHYQLGLFIKKKKLRFLILLLGRVEVTELCLRKWYKASGVTEDRNFTEVKAREFTSNWSLYLLQVLFIRIPDIFVRRSRHAFSVGHMPGRPLSTFCCLKDASPHCCTAVISCYYERQVYDRIH